MLTAQTERRSRQFASETEASFVSSKLVVAWVEVVRRVVTCVVVADYHGHTGGRSCVARRVDVARRDVIIARRDPAAAERLSPAVDGAHGRAVSGAGRARALLR